MIAPRQLCFLEAVEQMMKGGRYRMDVWENLIALNSHVDHEFEVLGPASEHRLTDTHTDWSKESLHVDLDLAATRDLAPLPSTKDREGYYGPHHFSYWASGLRDATNLLSAAKRLNVPVGRYLDMGCASGRVIRHFAFQNPEIETYGCDINRAHVEWVQRYLPENLTVFQNHSIPTLPLPDESFDMISAFSVFTHIEAFETSWLMELRRLLRPGGIAWITVHSEKTWEDMTEDWPLYKALKNHPKFKGLDQSKPMPEDRMVFRWKGEKSYSSNVFYSFEYLNKYWNRYLKIVEVHRRLPVFQDVIIVQKAK
ncbi:MAG: class I SAM-dependent methyltransferase [Pseudomonadota bacterium]